MLNLKMKKLTDTAITPTKAHPTDACFDIYADSAAEIKPHETVIIHTGFSTEIPSGYWAAIFARSGLASKQGLRPAQGVPVIDEPYRGEWLIPLHNDSEEIRKVAVGDRICQFMLLPYYDTIITTVDGLSTTDRGDGGFGSSGI